MELRLLKEWNEWYLKFLNWVYIKFVLLWYLKVMIMILYFIEDLWKRGKSRYVLIIIVLKSMFIDNCVIEIWE